jgi:hypothetical protein
MPATAAELGGEGVASEAPPPACWLREPGLLRYGPAVSDAILRPHAADLDSGTGATGTQPAR